MYPINPKATQILGCKVYPDLVSVPSDIDLAVIALPAAAVMKVIEQCGRKKIDSVVIISVGFKEVGPQEE